MLVTPLRHCQAIGDRNDRILFHGPDPKWDVSFRTNRLAGDKIGDRKVRSITPVGVDKLYEIVLDGPDGERPRQAEKIVALCLPPLSQ